MLTVKRKPDKLFTKKKYEQFLGNKIYFVVAKIEEIKSICKKKLVYTTTPAVKPSASAIQVDDKV